MSCPSLSLILEVLKKTILFLSDKLHKITEMNNKIIRSMEGSPIINIAALIIIFAGVIYAKSIITPFLLALFISIICAQPISWLEKKRMPRWLALIIVMLGSFVLFSGFAFLFGGYSIVFFRQPFKI